MNKKEKCSKSQQNRIVIHKGDSEKRVYQEELHYWLSEGWAKGWSDKHRQAYCKSKIGKTIKGSPKSEETRNKISESLKEGYSSGKIKPWNSGLDMSDDRVRNNINRATSTKIERYGSAFHNNNMSDEHKQKIGKSNSIALKGHKLPADKLLIKTTKQYLTKKKNNTFNSSKDEELLYEELLKENRTKTIYRNYRDSERYPFYCDFYIKEDDLFIELNAHWTHGGKPYDPNDEECQNQLIEWQEKAKTSQFYKNAIETWTVRDVKKLQCAQKNKLNYKVIY